MSGQEKLWKLNQKIRNTKACDEGVTRCLQAIKVVFVCGERAPQCGGSKNMEMCISRDESPTKTPR